MILERLFDRKKLESTDLSEHMDTLRKYASECPLITEFGVRRGCSTAALLAGLPASLISYDIDDFSESGLFREIAKLYHTTFKFIKADDCSIEIDFTDLLFIDTIHTHKQLSAELKKHESRVKKYIIMHDTHVKPSAASPENDGAGMRRAISELVSRGNWKFKEDFTNQHGLTILERI